MWIEFYQTMSFFFKYSSNVYLIASKNMEFNNFTPLYLI